VFLIRDPTDDDADPGTGTDRPLGATPRLAAGQAPVTVLDRLMASRECDRPVPTVGDAY
jgi:hypothetical protein